MLKTVNKVDLDADMLSWCVEAILFLKVDLGVMATRLSNFLCVTINDL
jgi:hypothetical protein